MARSERQRRTSINGVRNVQTVAGKEPGFEYRWVSDVDNRVQLREEMGYEIVKDSTVKVGDKRVANPSADGSPVTVTKGGTTQFLMRIKKDWYDEDQQAKAEHVNKLEASMKADAAQPGMYGKVEITRS